MRSWASTHSQSSNFRRVSAVDGALPDTILTGCYDGQLRIWNGRTAQSLTTATA